MGNELIPVEVIETKIYYIRDQKVMLDYDLAKLYEVETRIINRNVKRHIERFPEDFMFQLTDSEYETLRSQIGISKEGKGGRRYNPYVFTEQGIAMLSSVLNSKRAIQVNIQIMRIFVKLKQVALTHQELSRRLDEVEAKYDEHDEQIQLVFQAIKQLIEAPEKPQKQIGFKAD